MDQQEPSDRAAAGSVEGRPDVERDEDDQLSRFPGLAGKLQRLLREEAGPESAGRTLGDYRILREIGRGGMATVYEAEQISLRRRVALKILSAHLSLSERAVQKFQREAEAASRQTHPGVVTVHALGEEDGVYYIAAELVEGGRTLADQLEEQRRAGETERGTFRRVAEQLAAVAEALEHVHASGVIHRDVKPSNILITPEGRPRITDFGLARVEDALALSRTGDFLGTPYYMSPEQVLGGRRKLDHRTDIFSLGVTLYECLTLERPFGGDTPQEVLNEIVIAEPRTPLGSDSRVPRDLRVICLKALDKDRRHRYQTMAEFAEDLRRFLAGEAILARPVSVARRGLRWFHRRRAAVVVVATIVLAAAVVGVLGFELYRQQQLDRELATASYMPWREALGWPTRKEGDAVAGWIAECLPGSPSASLIYGYLAFSDWELEDAAEHLTRCLAESEDPPPGALQVAPDAGYLLALVELARAEASRTPAERDRRLATAGDRLRRWGADASAPGGTVILRQIDRPEIPEEGMRLVQNSLQLDREHALVRLFRSIHLFADLYQGGEIAEFRDAIRGFRSVLDEHPGNVPALTFAARTSYFFARTYEFLDLLRSARDFADRAEEHAGDRPYFLNHVTKGQIALLVGDDERALEQFRESIEVLGERPPLSIHNAYRGMGQVQLRAGNEDAALEWYGKTLSVQRHDPHISVAMAEYLLSVGEPARALEYATAVVEHRSGKPRGASTVHSSVYLACARAHLALGDEASALASLEELNRVARDYPRSWALACLLLPTLKEETITGSERLPVLARELAWRAGHNAIFEDRSSPVCLAAQGAAEYLRGNYPEAVLAFDRGLKERDRWPDEIRAFRWPEDARDRYYLAIVHAASAREAPSENPDTFARAREQYDLAERAYETGTLYPEDADLLERVRDKAREVLGISE